MRCRQPPAATLTAMYLITGAAWASGRVSDSVVELLRGKGEPVRVMVRRDDGRWGSPPHLDVHTSMMRLSGGPPNHGCAAVPSFSSRTQTPRSVGQNQGLPSNRRSRRRRRPCLPREGSTVYAGVTPQAR